MPNFSLDEVSDLVLAAGRIIRNTHERRIASSRSFSDVTTEIDYEIENFLKPRLLDIDPGSQIVAEESFREYPPLDRATWVLDPIDGTTNFLHRLPVVAISLSYIVEKEVTFGIVYNPFTEEFFSAASGGGSFLNGRQISVSGTSDMESALMGFGLPYDKAMADEIFPVARRIFGRCQALRRLGSAALDLAYVACGRLDGFFELDLKPWDYSAGTLLVREAGGIVTNWAGQEIHDLRRSSIAASNGTIHELLLGGIRPEE